MLIGDDQSDRQDGRTDVGTSIHREYAESQLGGVQAFDVLDIAHEEGLAPKELSSEITEAVIEAQLDHFSALAETNELYDDLKLQISQKTVN